jgi:hypothetical protein
MVNPQFPMMVVVTPWSEEQLPSESQKICASKWACPSMKPGATKRPVASTSASPLSAMGPTVTTLPAEIPTSAFRRGSPDPSMTVPPRITRS